MNSMTVIVEMKLDLAYRFVELVRGRWTLAVLDKLAERGRRDQEIHDALDGVSYKILTDTLRRAERDRLVFRQIDLGRIETATLYQLTDLDRSALGPLSALAEWVEEHWRSIDASNRQWDAVRRNR